MTQLHSCSIIKTKSFCPQNDIGVVYSKKSPQGGQVTLVHGIGTVFSLSEKRVLNKEAKIGGK